MQIIIKSNPKFGWEWKVESDGYREEGQNSDWTLMWKEIFAFENKMIDLQANAATIGS